MTTISFNSKYFLINDRNAVNSHPNVSKAQKATNGKSPVKQITSGLGVLLVLGVIADLCLSQGKNIKKITKYIKPRSAKEQTLKAIRDCENLTFNSPNLKLIKKKYNKRNIYDLGLRYAIIGKNTKIKTGTALIKNKIPELFAGIDEKSLIESLDKLPQQLYDALVLSYPKNSGIIKFEDKILNWHYIGRGGNSTVYKLSDETGNAVCFKYANRAYDMPGNFHGIIDEVAILNEANKAGVKDVPKLYLANIFGRKPNPNSEVEGAWQIVEFIDKNKKAPDGLKLESWLESKNLLHSDNINNPNNRIGDFIVDMGGICSRTNKTVDSDLVRKNLLDIFM